MSFTRLNNRLELAEIILRLSIAFRGSIPAIPSFKDSVIPMIPFSGVRSSWEVFAKNWSFSLSTCVNCERQGSRKNNNLSRKPYFCKKCPEPLTFVYGITIKTDG